MKKSTVWKILFKDWDLNEAKHEELEVLVELENCVKEDPQSKEISQRIVEVETNESLTKQ